MVFESLDQFLAKAVAGLPKGPVAMIFVEDRVEVASTVVHHCQLGFSTVIVLAPKGFAFDPNWPEAVRCVRYDVFAENAVTSAVTRISAALPGRWCYYCYNAEYLFYPFMEDRTVGEMLAFHGEERRSAMLSYVVDLYAQDLTDHPDAVSRATAHLDKSGYYALARKDPDNNYQPKERQLDFYGGIRWRFEEHVPEEKRRIDRIGLFRAKPGLELKQDHCFNDEEYNTYACPWHHNLTVAICSFRTAKALRSNPGSRHEIDTFTWHNSVPFDWSSRQLLELGLIEPGQWF